VTRVDGNGNVIAGSNAYVSDAPLNIAVNPNVETGNTISTRNGCGCKIFSFKFPDTFNWWEFSFQDVKMEPQLQAFMLGAETVVDGALVVGLAFPGALACDEDPPAVALEFWTKRGIGNGTDPLLPWWHFVFPQTSWQWGNNTFDDTAAQPTLTGFSQANGNWGDGPYGDGPPDGQDLTNGGYWATDVDPPDASCVATTVTSTS
jgi:hypothetical protein